MAMAFFYDIVTLTYTLPRCFRSLVWLLHDTEYQEHNYSLALDTMLVWRFTLLSTPEEQCIGFPEQKCISEAGKKGW